MNNWQRFPLDALPDGVARYVRELAEASGNDESWAALIALTAAAGRIGNRAAAIVKSGWAEPSILWAAIVQRSGTCKSAPLRLAMRPIIEQYKSERLAYAQAHAEYEAALERHKIELAEWQKRQRKGDSEEPPPARPIAPVEKRLLVSDITTEKLGALLQENPLGLLLVRDELAAWLGSFDRYASGKGSDGPTWLSFYDAANVTIDRKNGGTLFVERAAVSVLGTIQPGTLCRIFGQAERESGLLARLLLVMPPCSDGKWTDGELAPTTAAAWASTLQRLGDMPHGTDEHGDAVPHWVPLSRSAKAAFIQWHNEHMAAIGDGTPDDLAAHLAKLKGNCIRFALILACLDHAPLVPARIEREHVERAIALANWFAHEARRVYGMLATAPEDGERKRLIDFLVARGGMASERETRHGCRWLRGPGMARDALQALADDGIGAWDLIESGTGRGRPKSVLRLCPRSHKSEKPCENSNYGDVDTGDTLKNDDDGPPWDYYERLAEEALGDDSEGGRE